MAPVDTPQPPLGQPLTDPARRNWVKKEHADCVQRCWWWNGFYDLSSPGLRKHKVAVLGEPLPIGRRWRHCEDATAYVRGAREMTLEMEERSGRPIQGVDFVTDLNWPDWRVQSRRPSTASRTG